MRKQMNCKFYLIEDSRLFCVSNDKTFELKNNEWIKTNNNEITDRLIGYVQSEPNDSLYAIGNTDIMSSIKELTLEEIIEKYGESTIRKIKKVSKEAYNEIIKIDVEKELNTLSKELISKMKKQI